MKKLAILTSVLALAACGGGSGGGNGGVAPITESGMRVSSEAIESNKNVTSMASEILVASDGVSSDIVRAGKVINGGKHYAAYHLDDAKFFGNDSDFNTEYISFDVDDRTGQIDEIEYHFYDEEENEIEDESIERERPDNSVFTQNVYKYKVELNGNTYYTDSLPVKSVGYTKDQIKAAFRDAYKGETEKLAQLSEEEFFTQVNNYIDKNVMDPTEYTHRHVVDLQGKTLSNKLRYSDFGYTTILAKEVHEEGDGKGDDNSVIFGGYEIKEIKNPANLRDMEFKGKAIAAIGPVHENGDTKIETDNNAATLRIDETGKQTLTMPFKDYYTISVENPQNPDAKISWTGETKLSKGYALGDPQYIENQDVNIIYYGDHGIPSEAVGGVKFQNNNVEFNGAFGLKK